MLFKILKEYLRRILRNYKIYAVSILGLSIAIIASFHIYHFVYKEMSVDKFHENRKQIYRVATKFSSDSNFRFIVTSSSLGPLLKEKLPEVKEFIRFEDEPLSLYFEGNQNLRKFAHADPSFFELFNFRILSGSLETFKTTPNGVFLTQKMAKELFADKNPIGEVLTISEYKNPNKRSIQVVGIIEDFSKTSTIQAEAIINFQDYIKSNNNDYEWSMQSTNLYLYIPNLKNPKALEVKISDELFKERNRVAKGYKITEKSPFYLQRLDEVYFHSLDISEQEKKGNLQFVKVISLIGILVLVFGGLNYIIMNIGLNSSRVKEFTTKRSLGATKKIILIQLILESILNVSIALAIAFMSYPLLNPYISKLIGFDYSLSLTTDAFLLFTYLCLILVIGLIIGFIEFSISYRSIVLSIKTNLKNTFKRSNKYIIGFQLVLSIATIISILVIKKQVNYIETKDLGFDLENTMSVSTLTFADEIKNLLESKSYVHTVSIGQSFFNNEFSLSNTKLVKLDTELDAMVIQGDDNYLKVHNMNLLEGRNLNPTLLVKNVNEFMNNMHLKSQDLVEVLVNETFVKRANLKNPIGTILTNGYATGLRKGVVVGVFKDVYNLPLYYPVQPIILGFDFSGYPNIFQVSFKSEYKDQLKTDLRSFFKKKGIEEDNILERLVHTFDYEDIYKKELQLKRLVEAFTVIVLFISILGLVAISLFVIESKTKEIGIRKVNGATINEIMIMLNKDFIGWVGTAFMIACPIAYFALHKWLENFAYKTELSWWVFAISGIFILVVSLLTVSWQTYRAATRNPVESIRDE